MNRSALARLLPATSFGILPSKAKATSSLPSELPLPHRATAKPAGAVVSGVKGPAVQQHMVPLLIIAFVTACSPYVSRKGNRSAIVARASNVAAVETKLAFEIDRAIPLLTRVSDRSPTPSVLAQLSDYANRIAGLYNEMAAITPPREARQAQDLYSQNCPLIAESARYYFLAVKMNDVDYFNPSSEVASEANRIGSQAYHAFQALLDEYAITCEEINYCE